MTELETAEQRPPVTAAPRAFTRVLADMLVVSVTHFTVWFAVTFWVYLETRSVFATGLIAGIYLALTALCGVWFGSLVDHHRKRTMMVVSSAGSLVLYAAAAAVYAIAGADAFRDPTAPVLWLFVLLLMSAVLVGNIRQIAMQTVVTLLIPEDRRDKANGLVGTIGGVGFLVTSAISGVLVGLDGMRSVLVLALVTMTVSIVHLALLRIDEPEPAVDGEDGARRIDLAGTWRVVRGVPGLVGLIAFAAINNLLFGVFIALVDPYGLNLVSVEVWGLLWAFLSTGLILGGLAVGRWGLGRRPLRAMLLANVVIWVATVVYPLQSWIALLTVGLFVTMALMPLVEAAEQTVLQKVVPFERQGRVFGFAQSVEMSASPLTALLVSPLAQFVTIPFMTTGAGVGLIGGWFGTGEDRGIALLLVASGLAGFVVTLVALRSRSYRLLSASYAEGSRPPAEVPVPA